MKKLLLVLLLISQISIAQKEELNTFLQNMSLKLDGPERLHVEYMLTVKEKAGLSDSMLMNLYKDNFDQQLVMGDQQEIIQKGYMIVIANHVNRIISCIEDSNRVALSSGIAEEITAYVDSALNVKKSENKGIKIFTLTYNSPFIPYSSIEFRFRKSTGDLEMMKAFFGSNYSGTEEYFETKYLKWDSKWKPEKGYKPMEKYITKTDKGIQAQRTWKEYQFFHPEKGTLKL